MHNRAIDPDDDLEALREISRSEIVGYIAELLEQMEVLAKANDLLTLAQLIYKAQIEAQREVSRSATG